MKRLFPIERSIVGPGIRDSLEILREHVPLTVYQVSSGAKVLDWEVPLGWVFRSATISGHDFEVWPVYGCEPFSGYVEKETTSRIHTLPNYPDWIPYVTNYYGQGWGIAMRHRDFERLDERCYVALDCERKPGHLNYGELIIPGDSKDEILFSTYLCHPKMAINELSGPVVWTALAEWLLGFKSRRYTYRFYIGPETIGAMAYISQNLNNNMRANVKAGWVMTCLAGPGNFYLQHSREGRALADRVSAHALNDHPYTSLPWKDRASDERQFCAPGVDLPVCSVQKTNPGSYPEYHTSADNLDLVTPEQLEESLGVYQKIVTLLERNYRYQATHLCEPMMSKRGLYPTLSTAESARSTKPLLDVLSMCDGRTMLEIAEGLRMSAFDVIVDLETLEKHELVRRIDE